MNICMNMNRRRFRFVIITLLCSVSLMAQNTMRVHYNDGTRQDIPISRIDSVTFIETAIPEEDASLIGSWLWGNKNAGYYELITFSEDHTYTGYDNYFSLGFDTWTYGWYSQFGVMLTLQSNGFGYRRMYNWYLVGLSSNALEVMTNTGGYTYYRLQPEAVYVSLSEPFVFEGGDCIIFADGVVVKGEENTLIGSCKGMTYVLVEIASRGEMLAYKVIVE